MILSDGNLLFKVKVDVAIQLNFIATMRIKGFRNKSGGGNVMTTRSQLCVNITLSEKNKVKPMGRIAESWT